MIPVPLSWAALAVVISVCSTILVYEGVPFLIEGRVDRQYQAGRLVERQVWEELRRREAAAREAERQQAQTKIDSIESEYWRQRQLQSFKISELEKALAAEPEANPACACPPAVSERLRNIIDAAGR